MNTQLDEKQRLVQGINLLSASEIQKLKVFIAGIEAGKAIRKQEYSDTTQKPA